MQAGDDFGTELGRFGVGDPEAEGVFAAFHVHVDGQVGDLGGGHALVLDSQPQAVDIEDRVHFVQGLGLPQRDFVGHHFGDVGDQFP
ncbi:hypothetical protein BB31_39600 [Amycolatopsis lurida NRRL 2430]|uniref:Uncharacterized protein n=1 Tax=Amycolatopsis lurida NRRL 2430 TaxID=1460371 RepID=A0A2P2FGF7_AMYLU|nr:hypothetical protein BB31_39600 [Amycolatopsis lurida NRRL 2430]